MHKPSSVITAFVLDRLADETVAVRAGLYRALAAISANQSERKSFTALADECDKITRAHRQLTLDFKRRAEG